MKQKNVIIWVGIGAAIFVWVFEAIVHVLIFNQDNLFRAIFITDYREILTRLIPIFFIIILSIYVQHVVTRHAVIERRSLKRSYAFTKLVLDSMNDAISVIDVRNYRIIAINKTFLKEYALEREEDVIGKTCYEVTHNSHLVCGPPDDICPLKDAVETGEHRVVEHMHYDVHAGRLFVEVSATPIKDENGQVIQVIHVTRDITARKKAEEERERLIHELQKAVAEIKALSGLLPICANCKKIRDDSGYWNKIEDYISSHSNAEFSHGLCPDCSRKLYPEYSKDDPEEK